MMIFMQKPQKTVHDIPMREPRHKLHKEEGGQQHNDI